MLLHRVVRATLMPPFVLLIAALSAGLLVLSPPAGAATTTGSGRVAVEQRPVAAFQAITVAAGIDVTVRQGAGEAVEVQADDNLLPLIETTVEPGPTGPTLVLRLRRGESIQTRKPLRVTIDVVRLSALTLSGSGDVQVEPLKTPSLALSISGSGDAWLRGLDTDDLQARIVGSGDLRADGRARRVRLSIAGSGDAALADLLADDVVLKIAGSGDARVHAAKSLDISVAGSGDVAYSGNPPSVKTSVAGSGEITRR